MDSKRWVVHAERVARGELFAIYRLGPFRFKAWARIVAWLETHEGQGWQQSCAIIDIHQIAQANAPVQTPPWSRLRQTSRD